MVEITKHSSVNHKRHGWGTVVDIFDVPTIRSIVPHAHVEFDPESGYARPVPVDELTHERDYEPTGCKWFALCTNEATMVEDHPILGEVPICGRCKAKNERLQAA